MAEDSQSNPFQLLSLAMNPNIGSVVFEQEMESTNTTMLKMGKIESDSLPLVLIAKRQTEGRGRDNNSWDADSGGLTFSIGLDKKKLGIQPTLIALLSGLSIQKGLSELCSELTFQLKWPNDVLVMQEQESHRSDAKEVGESNFDFKKIGGVLIESNSKLLVVGIGVNINNQGFPKKKATNLKLASRSSDDFDLQLVLETILKHFFATVKLAKDEPQELIDQCNQLMFHLGKTIKVDTPSGTVTGKNTGLGDAGELLIESDGKTQSLVSGKNIRVVTSR